MAAATQLQSIAKHSFKKMPRLARKCQGGSGLRRLRKIAQLNSAYRLVKKEHTLKEPKCEHRCENF
jgi:hypothetical protein